MNKYATPEIVPGVFAIGITDWSRRIFDAISPTPIGTTYNSYLIKGKDKIALIDTNKKGFGEEYFGKIKQLLGNLKVDYIVMNHAEPDHAGLIPKLLSESNARLICTKRGKELAQVLHHVAEDRIDIVKEGDGLNLGGKTLQFIPQPFIHWPETMMTYLVEDKILFSCDFFGSHNTTGLFDDQAEDVITWAKKYYAEIMMPFAKMGRMAMDKIKDLEISMIAPSHGPTYRDPKSIMDEYARWTGEITKEKVLIIYVTMYHSVEKMVHLFAEQLKDEGIEVFLFDLVNSPLGELPYHMVDSRAVVLGTPTVLGGMHPLAIHAANTMKLFKPPFKYGVILNSYGWAKHGLNQGISFLEEMKIEVIDGIGIIGSPSDEDIARIQDAARQLAGKVKSGT